MHSRLRSLVQSERLDNALSLIKSKDFYTDQESRLLKLLELGGTYHLKGNYRQSLKALAEAQELSEELFTKSISKKLKTVVASDRSDNYHGERYELSLLRFYQALNHLLLFKEASSHTERRGHLQSARAVILEWDSFLDDDDMMAKLLGAVVHEFMGTRNELNIARHLYRDAKKLLKKHYNTYLPPKGELAKTLINYIDNRLKKIGKKDAHNVHIVVTDGLINSKRAKKIQFPIVLAVLPLGIADRRGFSAFVRKTLHISGNAKPAINLELPYIAPAKSPVPWQLVLKNKQGIKIKETSPAMGGPLSAIAHQTLKNQMSSIKSKTGLRVAGKHLTALAGSYLSYKSSLKKGQGEAFASTMASATYTLASIGIDQSERADLRYWATLPDNIWISSLRVKPGEYLAYAKFKNVMKKLGEFTVKKDQSNFLKFHIF